MPARMVTGSDSVVLCIRLGMVFAIGTICLAGMATSSSSAMRQHNQEDSSRKNVLITSSAVHDRVEPLMILGRKLHEAGMRVTVALPDDAVRF
eukprot:SAG31_NODE_4296_length_3374_cov_1.438473_2_plen_93_part_00